MFGREKAHGESDWKRRLGYRLLGEMHIPGRLRVWHIIKELRRLSYWQPAPITLLDAGGGEGAFAYHCARRFPQWQVVVADDEPDTLARGQQIKARLALHNLEVRRVDLTDFHEENAYNIVICSDVLEHIEADDLAVRNLARALKPGGILCLTSPSIPQRKHLALVARRERRIGFDPAQYGHVRDGYSAADMQRFLQHSGLKIESIRWTFGRFGTLMFDLFFVTGDSQPQPFVYALLFPVYMGLAGLDVLTPNHSGSAIMAIGRKL
jgi:2-polyprenyl-3-methyl-5-hydroxy-6-metoxy-1,4-benzoquinol methylase